MKKMLGCFPCIRWIAVNFEHIRLLLPEVGFRIILTHQTRLKIGFGLKLVTFVVLNLKYSKRSVTS